VSHHWFALFFGCLYAFFVEISVQFHVRCWVKSITVLLLSCKSFLKKIYCVYHYQVNNLQISSSILGVPFHFLDSFCLSAEVLNLSPI
jgi:hypothetical protein